MPECKLRIIELSDGLYINRADLVRYFLGEVRMGHGNQTTLLILDYIEKLNSLGDKNVPK